MHIVATRGRPMGKMQEAEVLQSGIAIIESPLMTGQRFADHEKGRLREGDAPHDVVRQQEENRGR